MTGKTVAIRLSLAFLTLVAILMAIGQLGLSRMDAINVDLEKILDKQRRKVRLAREALEFSNVNNRLTMEIFLLSDREKIREALANRAQNSASITELIDKIESDCDSQEESDLLSAVKKSRTPYMESYKRALDLLDEGKRDAATAVMVQETLPELRIYHAAWKALVQFQLTQTDAATEQSRARYGRTRRLVRLLIVFAVVVAGAIAVFATHDITQEMKTRIAAERQFNRLNEQLEQRVAQRTEELARAEELSRHSLEELREYTQGVEAVNELVELLQCCRNLEEAHNQVARALSRFFSAGTLLMVNASRNQLDQVGAWGPAITKPGPFHPESCWALRRGRIHLVGPSSSGQLCEHVDAAVSGYMCVPLTAQGEALGAFCAQDSDLSAVTWQHRQAFALSLAEQISLTLANLRLRETLKYQSVRDPLTGLFNRRHMTESLERELHRATRNTLQVPVLMMDLDHFKQFNDSHGHAAGDFLLRDFGSLISSRTRGSDIACRYGGEEFVVILVDATLENARLRAESLRQQVRDMQVQQRGEMLARVTVSIGIAAFPDHGTSSAEIMNAADKALYEAKARGRDRVVVAEVEDKAQVVRSD